MENNNLIEVIENEKDTSKLNIINKNSIKYLLITIFCNPLVIMFIGFFIRATFGGSLGPVKKFFPVLITLFTSILILATLFIPIKTIKLIKKKEIGKKSFIFIMIFWSIPFIIALLASGSCTIGSIF